MDAPPATPTRILVVARPALGRTIELALRADGHEVHRTPDPAAVETLAMRLRPEVVVVALDLPWGDALAAARGLRDGARPVPVVLLGNDGTEPLRDGFPRLPVGIDAVELRAAITGLFATPVPR
jgi:CheY-like chemotaxis protein